jgi:hypothetical protein
MTFFSVIQDPRIERNKLYPLEEVIVITILATIAMAPGWEDIERYAKAKEAWAQAVFETGTRDTAPRRLSAGADTAPA